MKLAICFNGNIYRFENINGINVSTTELEKDLKEYSDLEETRIVKDFVHFFVDQKLLDSRDSVVDVIYNQLKN